MLRFSIRSRPFARPGTAIHNTSLQQSRSRVHTHSSYRSQPGLPDRPRYTPLLEVDAVICTFSTGFTQRKLSATPYVHTRGRALQLLMRGRGACLLCVDSRLLISCG